MGFLELFDDMTSSSGLSKEEASKFFDETIKEFLLRWANREIAGVSNFVNEGVSDLTDSKVLAYLASIPTDASLSIIASCALTGNIDFKGEGLSQLLACISGLAGEKVNIFRQEALSEANYKIQNGENIDDVSEFLKLKGFSEREINQFKNNMNLAQTDAQTFKPLEDEPKKVEEKCVNGKKQIITTETKDGIQTKITENFDKKGNLANKRIETSQNLDNGITKTIEIINNKGITTSKVTTTDLEIDGIQTKVVANQTPKGTTIETTQIEDNTKTITVEKQNANGEFIEKTKTTKYLDNLLSDYVEKLDEHDNLIEAQRRSYVTDENGKPALYVEKWDAQGNLIYKGYDSDFSKNVEASKIQLTKNAFSETKNMTQAEMNQWAQDKIAEFFGTSKPDDVSTVDWLKSLLKLYPKLINNCTVSGSCGYHCITNYNDTYSQVDANIIKVDRTFDNNNILISTTEDINGNIVSKKYIDNTTGDELKTITLDENYPFVYQGEYIIYNNEYYSTIDNEAPFKVTSRDLINCIDEYLDNH